MPRLLMAVGMVVLLMPSLVVMMVLLMQIVLANSTNTETGAPLKGPGRSSLVGGFKASGPLNVVEILCPEANVRPPHKI
jgi:hypothetical protein